MKKTENYTYGGEIEILAVDGATQATRGVSAEFLGSVESGLLSKDINKKPPNMGYDSSEHLLEIGLGVHSSLVNDVEAAKEAVGLLQESLVEDGISLVSTSYHPIEDPKDAYVRVLPKPIYELIRGKYKKSHIHPSVLGKTYPTKPETGRGWNHEAGTLAAAIQPWNSLKPEMASEQIGVLQATGFMFNLLLANSPYAKGGNTDKRDYRLEMWGKKGLTASSRYKSDALLTENLPHQPMGLADYYKHVLGNQRPLVIPHRVKKDVLGTEYKTNFMAVIQPPDDQKYSILDFLKAKTVSTVDIETGKIEEIKPSVAHIVNGFDFLYFPRYGARLRLSLPEADSIDPNLFARAIQRGDENTFMQLLEIGGIDRGGFVCAEGRVAATVLPTLAHPDWKRMAIPFVLQTAIVRDHQNVARILKKTGLSWNELTRELPEATNLQSKGFEAYIRGVNATKLALEIWGEAQKTLTREERELVGSEVDSILNTKQAPAEEQIEFVDSILENNSSLPAALLVLLQNLHISIPRR